MYLGSYVTDTSTVFLIILEIFPSTDLHVTNIFRSLYISFNGVVRFEI